MSDVVLAVSSGLAGVVVGGGLEYLRVRADRRHRWGLLAHDEFNSAARLIDRLANASLRWAGDLAAGWESPHPFTLVDFDEVVYDAYHVLDDEGEGPISVLLKDVRELAVLVENADLAPNPGTGRERVMSPGTAVTTQALKVRRSAESTRAWLKRRRAAERDRLQK